MRRAWLALLAAVLVLALGATLVAHGPGRAGRAGRSTLPQPAVERRALALTVADGAVTPAADAVPKGRTVVLAVTNRGARPVDVRLAGYEDRVHAPAIAPGATWRTEFVADLPGEDFAWLIDGRPGGRLAVTGSHLVEGHR